MYLYGLIALVFSLLIGRPAINLLKRVKAGATIQEELSQEQQLKVGTPLMGGFIFIIPIVVLTGFYLYQNQQYLIDGLIFLNFTLGYALIGFIDDYLKVVKKHSDGLSAKQKIVLQIGILAIYLFITSINSMNTTVYIPIINYVFDLRLAYIIFLLLYSIGFSNAVNLTDGMDGLLAGSFILSSLAYFFVATFVLNNFIQALSLIVFGSLIGYMKYNYHPAKVFMGDTGSLALGGVLISYALLTKTEIILVIIGAVYVIEALSVIIQVLYFKKTGGKRVFLMSPIHHHFALKGIKEIKVVHGFWLASAIFGFIGVLIMYVI
ncbi:MAG: phospho-N-acetylmuramoyl-pentapeptide-transferase [Clostridia bacterium]